MGIVVAVGLAEVISVVTILESVAAVGAVLSVVGAVTKNKTLSLIGAGLGVVGGVGALAAGALGGSAALFGTATATSTAGDAAAVAAAGDSAFITGTAAGDAALGAGDVGAGALGGGAAGDALTTATAGFGAADAVPDAVGALSGLPTPPVPPEESLSFASTAQDVSGAATPNPADAVAPGTSGEAVSGSSDLIPPPPAAPNNLGAVNPQTGETITSAVDSTGKVVSLPDSTSGLGGTLGKLVDYAGAHPVVALGALQAGGSFLTGAFSSLTPAQVAALTAQASANDAAAALTNQQRANLAQPKAVASLAPVTGAPAPLVPQGFINQPQQPRVTGVPA